MATALASEPRRSAFAGLDICREAGLALPDGAYARCSKTTAAFHRRDRLAEPDVQGQPRFDFTAITNPRWRVIAKEQITNRSTRPPLPASKRNHRRRLVGSLDPASSPATPKLGNIAST